MFDNKSQEQIGFYVYGLFHPDNPAWPFYIGKGCHNRVFSHAAGLLSADELAEGLLSPKTEVITKIKRAGKVVVQKIIRRNLSKEEAFLVEASLIDLVNHIRPETLKNRIKGQGVRNGIVDALDLAAELQAETLSTEMPVLLLKIDKRWKKLRSQYGAAHSIPVPELYKAVRGHWKVSLSRVKRAECVLAIAHGLVRAAFVAERWSLREADRRWGFTGKPATQPHASLVGKSVALHYEQGNQNPVRYINC